MSLFKSVIVLSVFVQFAVCLTLIEDVYLTKQLMGYFGDDLEEGSDEDGGAKVVSLDDIQVASLLSTFDIKERADHYWTRLGHRQRTRTTPEYGWETYYYNYAPGSGYGRRRKRHAKGRKASILQRLRRDVESEKMSEGMFTKDQKNYTSDMPRPMLDYKLKRGFNKCCSDADDQQSQPNEAVQSTKFQCLREVRRNRTKSDDNTTAIEGDGGLYNIFSCDRVNRWKATVTCTIDCMGQKLEMINTNGEIDVQRAKSVITENFATQSWQRGLSDGIIDKCYEEISANSPNAVLDKFGLKCNTKMAELVYCLWREFFIACPAEKQQRMNHCEKLRFVLKKNNENKFRN